MACNVLLEQENYQYIQLKLLCMDYTCQLISEMIIQSFHQQYYYNININTSNALNITDVTMKVVNHVRRLITEMIEGVIESSRGGEIKVGW